MKYTALLLVALAFTAAYAQEEAAGEAEAAEYEYNMWIPCAYGKGLFEPDCPCKPGTEGCEIPDIPCEEHYVRDCNDKCSPAFWIGNGACDNVAEKSAKKLIKKGKSPMWANFNCETFWYDGGDCDSLNGRVREGGRYAGAAYNIQMVADTVTSAPAVAVGALVVVALVAFKVRRAQYAEL